jgi:hypothetical protein
MKVKFRKTRFTFHWHHKRTKPCVAVGIYTDMDVIIISIIAFTIRIEWFDL